MHALLKSSLGWMVLVLTAAACGPAVGMLPAKTCEGGNVKDCRARCDQSHGESCYRLGWFYEEGEVFEENMNKAIKLYQRACDTNWAVACRALGILYWEGEDVKRNAKKAVKYYQKACDLGLPEACPTRTEVAIAQGKKPSEVDEPQKNRPRAPDAPKADTPEVNGPEAPTLP